MPRPVPLTPEQRSIRSSLAAHARWAQHDPAEGIKPARAAFLRRFEDQVDPDRTLPVAERERRVQSALRAHMKRLALASSRSRSRRQVTEALADEALEAEEAS